MERLAELVVERTGVPLTRAILLKIEADLRSVYDYEAVALAVTLEVDVRFLLGLQDLDGQPIPFRFGNMNLDRDARTKIVPGLEEPTDAS